MRPPRVHPPELNPFELPSTSRLHHTPPFVAILLPEQEVYLRTIMEILGHSDISFTLKTYSHVAKNMTRVAAKEVDAILCRDGEVCSLGSRRSQTAV